MRHELIESSQFDRCATRRLARGQLIDDPQKTATQSIKDAIDMLLFFYAQCIFRQERRHKSTLIGTGNSTRCKNMLDDLLDIRVSCRIGSLHYHNETQLYL